MVCKLKSALHGRHIEVRVFMGPDKDHLSLTGVLMMNVGEWQLFGAALLVGSRVVTTFQLIEDGEDTVISQLADRDHELWLKRGPVRPRTVEEILGELGFVPVQARDQLLTDWSDSVYRRWICEWNDATTDAKVNLAREIFEEVGWQLRPREAP